MSRATALHVVAVYGRRRIVCWRCGLTTLRLYRSAVGPVCRDCADVEGEAR